MNIYLFFILIVFSNFAKGEETKVYYKDTGKAFYEDRNRGWAAYEKPVIEMSTKEDVIEPGKPASGSATLSPREQLKKQGEDWEDAMAVAVLDPSNENLVEYLSHTQKIMSQSQDFATSFKEAIWITPEYDYSLKSPTSSQAVIANNVEQGNLDDADLYTIGDEKALLYFYSSTCEYCKRFSPILKRFSEKYGITISPITLDGGSMPAFPNPRMNSRLAKTLKVTVTPSIFLLEPSKNSIAPVSYGFQSYAELKKRVIFANGQLESDGVDNKISSLK